MFFLFLSISFLHFSLTLLLLHCFIIFVFLVCKLFISLSFYFESLLTLQKIPLKNTFFFLLKQLVCKSFFLSFSHRFYSFSYFSSLLVIFFLFFSFSYFPHPPISFFSSVLRNVKKTSRILRLVIK